MDRIRRMMKWIFDHQSMHSVLFGICGDLPNSSRFGIHSHLVSSCIDTLKDLGVMCVLDKRKQKVAVICPHFWQSESKQFMSTSNIAFGHSS